MTLRVQFGDGEPGAPPFECVGLEGPNGTVVATERDARHWNGWMVPAFTDEQADVLVEWCAAHAYEGISVVAWAATATNPRHRLVILDEDTTYSLTERHLADGTRVWLVDGWTWDVVD